jgi:hypothetical protein
MDVVISPSHKYAKLLVDDKTIGSSSRDQHGLKVKAPPSCEGAD